MRMTRSMLATGEGWVAGVGRGVTCMHSEVLKWDRGKAL